MLRMIWKQLWNNKGANAWISLELLLVFSLLWYIVDYLFVLGYNESLPSRRDINHTWQVGVALLPTDHPEYDAAEADSAALEANFLRLMDRIREAEGVEAVAVMNDCSTPVSGSYCSNEYRNPVDTARTMWGQTIGFDPRWDFFRVFRHTDPEGNPVSTAGQDWSDPRAAVLGKAMAEALFADGRAVGQEITDNYEGGGRYRILAVLGDTKRFDYLRPQPVIYTPFRVSADDCLDVVIAVRSSDQIADGVFKDRFKQRMSKEARVGNFYLKNVKSFDKISADTDKSFGQTGTIRTYQSVMLFFLLNIMLCVMGTFWYRVNRRRGEVGLRMAMGSARSGVRRLLFLEGLSLLTVVALVASVVNAQLVYLGMLDTLGQASNAMGYFPDRMVPRFLVTTLLTWIVLSLAILLAIWLPASRAARLEPAEALRYE